MATMFWLLCGTFLAHETLLASGKMSPVGAPSMLSAMSPAYSMHLTAEQAAGLNSTSNPKYLLPLQHFLAAARNKNSTALAVAPKAAIEGGPIVRAEGVSGFVRTSGTQFVVNGSPAYFAGTDAFYLSMRSYLSDNDVQYFFQTMANNGVTLVRLFGFSNGYNSLDSQPITKSPGNYDEGGLRRLDYILYQAANYGIRLIFPLMNYEPELGGIQWWVDNTKGYGQDKHAFYYDGYVKSQFKGYINTILYRRNTYTGVLFKDDPVILSWELGNEPHTSDLYERNQGKEPGKIVRDWVYEISAYIKGIDGNHLVSTGEEGYRADGPTNPPHNNWINGGWKGVDFVGNIYCPNIDFATLHVYPDNWGIQAYEYDWVNDNMISDRAKIARSAGKPIIIEETGCCINRGSYVSRETLLNSLLGRANAENFAATMVWQVFATDVNNNQYNFPLSDSDGPNAWKNQNYYMKSKTGNGGGGYSPPSPPSNGGGGGCTDNAPSSQYSCSQQVGYHPGCNVPWLSQGYCDYSCGRCSGQCDDRAPDNYYSCSQQVYWHPGCYESFLQPPFCAQSCGRCSSSCSDVTPNGSPYSCAQQAGYGKCGEQWMVASGKCLKSCGKC